MVVVRGDCLIQHGIQGSPDPGPSLSPRSCRMGMIPRQFPDIRCPAVTAPKLEATTVHASRASLAGLVTCLEEPKCRLWMEPVRT